MWDVIKSYNPGWLAFFCTALFFVIPYTVHKVNQMLNNYGNPAWKQEDEKEEE